MVREGLWAQPKYVEKKEDPKSHERDVKLKKNLIEPTAQITFYYYARDERKDSFVPKYFDNTYNDVWNEPYFNFHTHSSARLTHSGTMKTSISECSIKLILLGQHQLLRKQFSSSQHLLFVVPQYSTYRFPSVVSFRRKNPEKKLIKVWKILSSKA